MVKCWCRKSFLDTDRLPVRSGFSKTQDGTQVGRWLLTTYVSMFSDWGKGGPLWRRHHIKYTGVKRYPKPTVIRGRLWCRNQLRKGRDKTKKVKGYPRRTPVKELFSERVFRGRVQDEDPLGWSLWKKLHRKLLVKTNITLHSLKNKIPKRKNS